ncbi:MAG: hypothetical protein ACREDD_00025 [Methylocella sp.]
MKVFKLLLLALIRFAFVGVLKAVLFVYFLSRPDEPLVEVTPRRDTRTGDARSNSAQKEGVKSSLLRPDAYFS